MIVSPTKTYSSEPTMAPTWLRTSAPTPTPSAANSAVFSVPPIRILGA